MGEELLSHFELRKLTEFLAVFVFPAAEESSLGKLDRGFRSVVNGLFHFGPRGSRGQMFQLGYHVLRILVSEVVRGGIGREIFFVNQSNFFEAPVQDFELLVAAVEATNAQFVGSKILILIFVIVDMNEVVHEIDFFVETGNQRRYVLKSTRIRDMKPFYAQQ